MSVNRCRRCRPTDVDDVGKEATTASHLPVLQRSLHFYMCGGKTIKSTRHPLLSVWRINFLACGVSTAWSVAYQLQFESLSYKTQSCSFTTQTLVFTTQTLKIMWMRLSR